MKIKIGAYEAKTKLPELLRQVKAGTRFTITHRGEAVADLVPSENVKPTNIAIDDKLTVWACRRRFERPTRREPLYRPPAF